MFKKIAILSIGLILGIHAQEQTITQKVGKFATDTRAQLSAQIKKLNGAVKYLETARNCLRGIGCTKNQSYFANYTLGAALGTIQAITNRTIYAGITGDTAENIIANAKRAQQAIDEGKEDEFISESRGTRENVIRANMIIQKAGLLYFLIEELGYRKLVHQPVNLFKCVTFRGCDDQTKRYAFYRLGLVSGNIVAFVGFQQLFGGRLRKKNIEQIERDRREQEKKTAIEIQTIAIDDNNIKKQLLLNETKPKFTWYEILGLPYNASQSQVSKKYKLLMQKFHPDKFKGDDAIAKVISEAYDKSGHNPKATRTATETLLLE